MKICLAYKDSLGGWQSFNFNMANGFASKGHDVSLLLFDSAGNVQNVLSDKVKIIHIKKCTMNRNVRLAHIVGLIDSIDPDVVLNSDVDFIQAAFPYIGNEILRIPVIHSVALHEQKKVLANEEWVHAIVAVAPLVERELRCLSPGSRILSIPIGIDTNGSRSMASRSVSKDPLKICYVGRLDLVDKNLIMIVRCALYLRSLGVKFEWNIAGDGIYRPELLRKIDSAGLKNYFNFLGILKKSALEDFLARQHLFVMPSVYEGTPHAVLEAMFAGVVPVLSDIPGATSEIVENGKDGYLFNVTDPASCAKLVQKLDGDRELLFDMSKNAADKVKRNFALDQAVDRYLSLFDRLRSNPAPVRERIRSRPAFPPALPGCCLGVSIVNAVKSMIVRSAIAIRAMI